MSAGLLCRCHLGCWQSRAFLLAAEELCQRECEWEGGTCGANSVGERVFSRDLAYQDHGYVMAGESERVMSIDIVCVKSMESDLVTSFPDTTTGSSE